MTVLAPSFRLGLVLSLAAAAAWAQTAAPQPRAGQVKVSNSTKQAIVAVYTSMPDRGDWGDDMLGKLSLGAGKTLTLKINDPGSSCTLDFNALMADGGNKVQKAVNLCAADPQVQF